MPLIPLEFKITRQPPTIWYNQQGARSVIEITMTMNANFRNCACSTPAHYQPSPRRLDLSYLIEYESGAVVKNQTILDLRNETDKEIFVAMPPECRSCEGIVGVPPVSLAKAEVRIREVSSRHMGQCFRIRVRATPHMVALPQTDYGPSYDVVTSPVRVRAKQVAPVLDGPGRGRRRKVDPPEALIPPARDTAESSSALVSWSKTAFQVLNRLEWQTVGYEIRESNIGDPAPVADPMRPIRRCPSCGATDYIDMTGRHATTCSWLYARDKYRELRRNGVVPNDTEVGGGGGGGGGATAHGAPVGSSIVTGLGVQRRKRPVTAVAPSPLQRPGVPAQPLVGQPAKVARVATSADL